MSSEATAVIHCAGREQLNLEGSRGLFKFHPTLLPVAYEKEALSVVSKR